MIYLRRRLSHSPAVPLLACTLMIGCAGSFAQAMTVSLRSLVRNAGWIALSGLVLLLRPLPVWSEGLLCAPAASISPVSQAAGTVEGTENVVVLFAHFRDDTGAQDSLPVWSEELFDADLLGSFSHFYSTMSFGRFEVDGAVAPQRYVSEGNAEAYAAADPDERGAFGRFTLEILQRADDGVDFARFDNDGPDGEADSGDDDGYVDAVFVVLPSVPQGFLVGRATGIASLGFEEDFVTDDPGADGEPIRIAGDQGSVHQGGNFSEAVGVICHEYAHLLGLPDLFNVEFRTGSDPAEDSAGIGAWGLMGWGAPGWSGNDGPNAFSAWSRMRLGWAQVQSVARPDEELVLPDVGLNGDLYRIPVDGNEFFLLEYRRRQSSLYDRNNPGEGVLIWHVREYPGAPRKGVEVDLECADGRWRDAGFPNGTEPDPKAGEDNLDFWAHDADYRNSHAGNLGDGTDPYGGTSAGDFTPESNPESTSMDGRCCVSVEDIQIDGDRARARITTEPLRVEVANLHLQEENDDGLVVVGEEAWLFFSLNNSGGIDADVRGVLSATDQRLEVLEPETSISVGAGEWQLTNDRTGFVRFRLTDLNALSDELQVQLDLYVNGDWQERRHVLFRAVATSTWDGVVTDPAGQGIADVALDVGPYKTRTDADGSFAIEVPVGTYRVSVTPPSTAGAGYTRFTVDLAGNERTEVVLPDLVALTGEISHADGAPAMAFVVASAIGNEPAYSTTSDSSGEYELLLPRGLYDFQIIPTVGELITGPVLSDVAIERSGELDVQLDSGVAINLEVLNAEGLGTRLVFNLIGSASRGFIVTDNNGLVSARVLPDVYRMQVLPPGQTFLIDPRAVPDLQVTLSEPVDVSGTLSGALRQPFAEEAVFFEEDWTPLRDRDFGIEVMPGRYEITYRGSDGPRERLQTLETVSIDGDSEVHLVLEEQSFVTGRLVDEESGTHSSMQVRARSSDVGLSVQVRIGVDGTFALELRPGTYEFSAMMGGSTWHIGTASVVGGEYLEFSRPMGAAVRGRVTMEGGAGLEGVLVGLTKNMSDFNAPGTVFERGAGFLAAATTGPDGSYELLAPPGTYAMVILPPGLAYPNSKKRSFGRVIPDFSLIGDTNFDATLPFVETIHLVHGWVRLESNEPRHFVQVQFYDVETGIIAATRAHPTWGGYVLKLPEGAYEVRAAVESAVGGFRAIYQVGRLTVTGGVRRDIDLTSPTAVTEEYTEVPRDLRLEQNFPNPFNPATTIRYRLPEAGGVSLEVYNLVGQRAAILVDEHQPAGSHTLIWDGRDDSGRPVASGVYVYRLRAGDAVETRKLVLLK